MISKFPPEYSGPGVRIPRLYKYFQEKKYGFHLKIICNGIEYLKNEKYIYEDWPVRRITAEYFNRFFSKFIPKRISHSLSYQYEFIKTLGILFFAKSYKNIDFLHIAGHSGGTAAALVWARWKNIPVLLELVNSTAKPYQKFLYIFKATIPEKGKIAFLTQSSADIYSDIAGQKKWIKPNPVDTNFFSPSNDKKITRKDLLPFQETDIVMTSVAKFMPRKNQIFLISVLNELPKNYRLVLAGPKISKGPNFERDKSYFKKIKEEIKKQSLQSRVHIISDYVEADKYMKLSDIYVMPAWDEGLGTPMLEAISCGVPVVANKDEPAFQEWIRDEENGFLADINNPKEWAQAIIKAAKFNEGQKKQMAEAMASRVGQDKIFSQYEDIFKNLIRDL